LQLLGTLAIGQVMHSMGFDPDHQAAAQNEKASPAELQALMNQSLPAVLTGLLLFTPLIMATWFGARADPVRRRTPGHRARCQSQGRRQKLGVTDSQRPGVGAECCSSLRWCPYCSACWWRCRCCLVRCYASYQAIFAVWADDADASQTVDKLA